MKKLLVISVVSILAPSVGATVIYRSKITPRKPSSAVSAPSLSQNVRYFIDGKPASAAEIEALSSDSISCIDIRSHLPGGLSLKSEDADVLYFIDGVEATPQQIEACPQSSILSVKIEKNGSVTKIYLETEP